MNEKAELRRPVLGATPGPHSARRAAHYLHPGQIHAAAEPCEITTILGSCVAICLFSARLRVGGMNHFLMPMSASGEKASPKFGNVAFERLLERLIAFGCEPLELRAKVFGGACMLEALSKRHAELGGRNAEVAFELLKAARIPVISRDVGGQRARKLAFHTDDGSAWVRLL